MKSESLILVLVLLAAVAAGIYFFVIKKPAAPVQQQSPVTPTKPKSETAEIINAGVGAFESIAGKF